jgi:predicted porin
MIAAKYSFGPATIKAGYEQYHLSALNTVALYNAGVLPTSYFGYTYTPKNGSSSNNNLFFIGGDYKITPALDVALGVYDTQQTNGASGNQWQYSILADYRMSQRTDVYAGYMFSKFNGSEFSGYMRTNYIAALGMRTKF